MSTFSVKNEYFSLHFSLLSRSALMFTTRQTILPTQPPGTVPLVLAGTLPTAPMTLMSEGR